MWERAATRLKDPAAQRSLAAVFVKRMGQGQGERTVEPQSPRPADGSPPSPEDYALVGGLLAADTWLKSIRYLKKHYDRLMSPAAQAALGELKRGGRTQGADATRELLKAVRTHGISGPYLQLLPPAVGQWLAVQDWDASAAFVKQHPELLGPDVPAWLAELNTPFSPYLASAAQLRQLLA
jgi:hypothetical protein